VTATADAPDSTWDGGAPAAEPEVDLPERLGYRLKRRLLGPPLTNDRLEHQRLSKVLALGVLAPDCISSSAYGTEEILIELLRGGAALGAFFLVLPITGVVLAILVLLTLSYRQVVSVYTRAGGSYVVAREQFGPRVAQIAAVALLIDYVVTVAVQTAAGTVAVVSAVPVLGPYSLEITVGVVLLLCYGNLRGIREAGKAFAFPTYFFAVSMGAVVVTGVVEKLLGVLPQVDPATLPGTYPLVQGNGLVMGATVVVLLRAFANGGSSLTGLEAISNGVSTFRPPEGVNARRAMVVMSCTLGFLVGGVSLLAHWTHATPYVAGYPSVISQETQLVFGSNAVGRVLFAVVQIATALILYTGANTSFNGFPFLASFVAEDAFLPRQLRRRGHRLVFSNAIIVLTLVAVALLVLTGAHVDALVPFYAIGVFTGFTMAGFGMARYFSRHREGRWRAKVAVNLAAGATSLVVVLILAVFKFTEGAWLVVVVFPVLVVVLIRLNREYREEAAVLRGLDSDQLEAGTVYAHHVVVVLVDTLDLATVAALRYGRSLRPSELRAVHFVLDSTRADLLRSRWESTVETVPLELVDCPDRRLGRAVLQLLSRAAAPRTEVTVLLPRRTYAGALGRLLHDRTADRIARVVSRVPNAVATIVPFDVEAELAATSGSLRTPPRAPVAPDGRRDVVRAYAAPEPPADADPIGSLRRGEYADVEGRIRAVKVAALADSPLYACEVMDATGVVTAVFYGRRSVPGLSPGTCIRLQGRPRRENGKLVIANPRYRLVSDADRADAKG
jgi:amino acid transporter